MDFVSDFLLKPMFLHGGMGFLHLVLLVTFLVLWMCKKITVCNRDSSEVNLKNNTQYTKALFSSLSVSVINLVLFQFDYFNWIGSAWSDEKLGTLLGLAVSAASWGALCIYMHTSFISSGEPRFPLFFRVWCSFYLCFSCFCFIVDMILIGLAVSLPIQYLVSDLVCVSSGLFFCYMGIFVDADCEDNILDEPLLDDNRSVSNSSTKGSESVTPYSTAGLLSILTFSWMNPLIGVGCNKTIGLEHVPQLTSSISVFGVFPTFRNKLEVDCGTISRVTTPKLMKLLFYSAWKEVLWAAILASLYTVASYVGPYLIDAFVQYFNGQREFKIEGYLLVSLFLIAKLIECLTPRHSIFRFYQAGIKIRSVLVTIIYNKGLTLPSQSKKGHTAGELINLMAVDTERVGDFSWYMVEVCTVLLHVTLALLILYKSLGLASISALIATVIVMLANIPFGSLQEKFQGKLMESKDRRMKSMSEILRSMGILKLQGWEMKFLSKIIELRETEECWLRKYLYTSAMTTFVFWVAPSFISVVTFSTCILMGIPLEAGKILSALATFRILQESIYSLPETISMIVQIKVSLDRIS